MAILDRKELEQSPLADLHAIASELGIEGYRRLRKAELIDALMGGANGGGFMRPDPFAHSREDVYVSPAQIRRCELRPGDSIEGPVRPPRRSERYPSLVHVETVNGQGADPPPERPHFDDLPPVF